MNTQLNPAALVVVEPPLRLRVLGAAPCFRSIPSRSDGFLDALCPRRCSRLRSGPRASTPRALLVRHPIVADRSTARRGVPRYRQKRHL